MACHLQVAHDLDSHQMPVMQRRGGRVEAALELSDQRAECFTPIEVGSLGD